MLDRPALVIALVRDRRDDARLRIGPAGPADPRRLAQPRARAVGGDEQIDGKRFPVGQVRDPAEFVGGEALHPGGSHIDARLPAGGEERFAQRLAFDHVRKGLAVADLAVEGEEGRAHRVGEMAVGDHHVAHGLRVIGDPVPDAERREHAAGGGGDGVGALVVGADGIDGGIAQHDGEPARAGAGEREGERQAGDAAARDRDPARASLFAGPLARPRTFTLRLRHSDLSMSSIFGRASCFQHLVSSILHNRRAFVALDAAAPLVSLFREKGHPQCVPCQSSKSAACAGSSSRVPAKPTSSRAASRPSLRIPDVEPRRGSTFHSRSRAAGAQPLPGSQPPDGMAARLRRAGDRPGAGGGGAHGGGAASAFAARLLPAPGLPKAPIIYEVDRIRDGGSFTTRRVVAIQFGEAIFSMSASFHKEEPGFDHAAAMPDVPMPEEPAGEGIRTDAFATHAGGGAALFRARAPHRDPPRPAWTAISRAKRWSRAATSGSARSSACRTIRRSTGACSPMRPT